MDYTFTKCPNLIFCLIIAKLLIFIQYPRHYLLPCTVWLIPLPVYPYLSHPQENSYSLFGTMRGTQPFLCGSIVIVFLSIIVFLPPSLVPFWPVKEETILTLSPSILYATVIPKTSQCLDYLYLLNKGWNWISTYVKESFLLVYYWLAQTCFSSQLDSLVPCL